MRPTNIDIDNKLEKKLDKELFNMKYDSLLTYIEDIKANKLLLEERLYKLENKPIEKNKLNKFLVIYNIGSIVINLILLIKLFIL